MVKKSPYHPHAPEHKVPRAVRRPLDRVLADRAFRKQRVVLWILEQDNSGIAARNEPHAPGPNVRLGLGKYQK
jgi:hypothetical protein